MSCRTNVQGVLIHTGLRSSIVTKLKAFFRTQKAAYTRIIAELNGDLFQARARADLERRRADDAEKRLRSYVNVRTFRESAFDKRIVVDLSVGVEISQEVENALYRDAIHQLVASIKAEQQKGKNW